jgi:type I restriction enzyme, S subunit
MSARSKPKRDGKAPAMPVCADLPEGWAISSVGDCFHDVRNGTTASQNKVGVGIPVSRIETIQNRRFDMTRVQHLEDANDDFVENFRYRPGDIAFSHINSFEHVGKTALYEGEPEVFIHGMNLLRLRLGHSFVEPKFAHLFMQTQFFREEVRQRVGHAVNQVSINQKNLAEVPFIIAPIAEQRRIVAKLELLLGKVSSSQQRLSRVPGLLKRFRQSVLAAACSGKLTADWREENARDSDYTSVSLDEVADYIGGFAYRSTTFLPTGTHQVIRIGNVRPMQLDVLAAPVFIPDEIATETERFQLQPNDIIISMTGTKYKRDYGHAAMVEDHHGALFLNQRVSRVRCGNKILPRFLLYWMHCDFFRDHFFAGETGNVNQGNVGADGIRKAPIALPPPCPSNMK